MYMRTTRRGVLSPRVGFRWLRLLAAASSLLAVLANVAASSDDLLRAVWYSRKAEYNVPDLPTVQRRRALRKHCT
jgi:hypothetical protein